MAWGVRWYLVGSIVLGVFGVLAGCSGGMFFAEREPWRHDAEVQCLNSGAVKEGAGIARIQPIRGPGVCGADFPLKVSILGEYAPLGYSDDLRPPGEIPRRTPRRPAHTHTGGTPAPPPGAPGEPAGPPSRRAGRPLGPPAGRRPLPPRRRREPASDARVSDRVGARTLDQRRRAAGGDALVRLAG